MQDSVQRAGWINHADYYSVLYTGKEEMRYPISYINHPFYLQKEPIKAFLAYDGVDYPEVGLRWDNYKDELIVISKDQRYTIVLIPDRLEEARFLGNDLFYLDVNKLTGISRSGYYLKLYDNNLKVWAKPSAVLNTEHVDQRVQYSFSFNKRFYIQKGDTLYPVKKLSGVLRVLSEKKKELKQFAKKNKLNVKANPEKAIPDLVNTYEQLIKVEQP
jgi:hypothetical protein